jgi:hypothetical protein
MSASTKFGAGTIISTKRFLPSWPRLNRVFWWARPRVLTDPATGVGAR